MRISKVTTRTGDAGQTSLANGDRVSKSSLRIAAGGDVDELNSLLGLVRRKIQAEFPGEIPTPNEGHSLDTLLNKIQNHLFVLGADLSSPEAKSGNISMRRIAADEVEILEAATESYNATLPPLREFVLPGGNEAGSLLHLARTVARRAERAAVALAAAETVGSPALIYLNRLSDLLFVLARFVNRLAEQPESSADFH